MIKHIFILQEFDITIFDKHGIHNVVAIFVSRLTHAIEKEIIDYAFSNKNPFFLSIQSPRFVDIENSLATRKLLQYFMYKEK